MFKKSNHLVVFENVSLLLTNRYFLYFLMICNQAGREETKFKFDPLGWSTFN